VGRGSETKRELPIQAFKRTPSLLKSEPAIIGHFIENGEEPPLPSFVVCIQLRAYFSKSSGIWAGMLEFGKRKGGMNS
jgi:hypothetical protein